MQSECNHRIKKVLYISPKIIDDFFPTIHCKKKSSIKKISITMLILKIVTFDTLYA